MTLTRRRTFAALLTSLALAAADTRGGEFSPEYQASLKRTSELRKQRRRANLAPAEVGAVVPYPMPPALIVRQTPGRHDEVRGLLDLLRYGGR